MSMCESIKCASAGANAQESMKMIMEGVFVALLIHRYKTQKY